MAFPCARHPRVAKRSLSNETFRAATAFQGIADLGTCSWRSADHGYKVLTGRGGDSRPAVCRHDSGGARTFRCRFAAVVDPSDLAPHQRT